MPAKQEPELTERQIKRLMRKAHEIVDRNFDPQAHLPLAVYDFLQPIVNSTCQGFYSCTLMMLGGMPALTNGAQVQIWGQKPTPLVAAVFQIGEPQAGKSRLFAVLEEMFDTCDDVIAEHVQELLDQKRGPAPGAGSQNGAAEPEHPVTVKSITLQSFTMPEFFARCSSTYPYVVFEDGDLRAGLGISLTPWGGRAFNIDESYELWANLDLIGKSRGEKDGAPSPHASTMNTLISSGKTRRATRSSTNFGGSRAMPVSISIVGNGHPGKFIAIDRGMVGNHTAATKERFLIALDHAVARHAALPIDTVLPEGVAAWTWLPLTPQQAEVFRWQHLFDDPDEAQNLELQEDDVEKDDDTTQFVGPCGGYVVAFPDGNESRVRYAVTLRGLRTEFRISSRWKLGDPTEHIRGGARAVAEHFKNGSECRAALRGGSKEDHARQSGVPEHQSAAEHRRWKCCCAPCKRRRAARRAGRSYGCIGFC